MKLEDVLKGKNVVNCKTMEEADKLFNATPQSVAIQKRNRQLYGENTAYNPNYFNSGWVYESVEYYKENGYAIIKFSDIDEFKSNKTRYFKCTKQLGIEKYFTIGGVYEVTDKKFMSDRGHNYIDSCQKSVDEAIKFLKRWYEFEEVKKDEFKEIKIGDRVIVNGERSYQHFNNAKGKVVTMDSTDYGVEFDDGKDFMHDLFGEGKSKHCYYVYKNMVTLDNTIKKEEEKVMNKFKVGDMVKGTERGSNYTYTDKDMTKGEVTKVYDKNVIQVKIIEHSKYKTEVGCKYEVIAEKFDLITPPKKSIHVTFDGDTTHAVVKEDGKVVKREKVGLCRGDVYDEATGVREVIDKLYGKKVVEDIKPKTEPFKTDDKTELWKCVWKDEDCGSSFTVGKTYRRYFSNGKMRMDDDSTKAYWVLEPECFSSISFERVDADNKSKSISEYTTDELLSEIKRRMEK